jgi:hypothetical protein
MTTCFEDGCRHGVFCLCPEQCQPPERDEEEESC